MRTVRADPPPLFLIGKMVSLLPGFGQLGVASALKCGYHVHLWTYGTLLGVPSEYGTVEVRDASTLVSLSKAKQLLSRGLGIQHLSDWVRLRAIQERHTSHRCAAYST